MPAGVETYWPNGAVRISLTTYVGTFYGSFSTGGNVTGSYTDVKMIGRSLLLFIGDFDGIYGGPTVTLNPTTGEMSWSYDLTTEGGYIASPTTADRTHTVYYGGY